MTIGNEQSSTLRETTLPSTASSDDGSQRLAAAGVVAGPLFLALSFAHGALRDGFSFSEHPPSLLSVGGTGWLQAANFVVAGLLLATAGVGLRRLLRGMGSTWGPRLLTVFGVALVGGGLFRMDPGFGFPAGTPAGVPAETSWHGGLHGLMFAVGFSALVAACFVFARRFRLQGRPGLRWFSIVAGPLSLVLGMSPNFGGDPSGRFLPLWVGVTVAFAWTTVVCAHSVESAGAAREA